MVDTEAAPTRDPDALDALAWIESGMPDSAVGYGPDAPRLAPEQIAEFQRASYLQAPERKSASPRSKKRRQASS